MYNDLQPIVTCTLFIYDCHLYTALKLTVTYTMLHTVTHTMFAPDCHTFNVCCRLSHIHCCILSHIQCLLQTVTHTMFAVDCHTFNVCCQGFFPEKGGGAWGLSEGEISRRFTKKGENSACLHFISTLQCHLPLLLALKPIHYLMIVNLT